MYCSTLLARGIILGTCSAGYVLETRYTAANWWNLFDFFTVCCLISTICITVSCTHPLPQSKDPTGGSVNYVDRDTAIDDRYIDTVNNQVYLGVDYTNIVDGNGRDSVRISSNAVYNYSLVVLDVSHMPGGICGTWQVLPRTIALIEIRASADIWPMLYLRPAFWMLGVASEWPNSGEIDIIEGINDNANNALTLHTSEGCSIMNDSAFTGTLTTSDCENHASGQPDNAGCDIQDQDTLSYGKGFNANGGGVIAMEWTSSVIQIWFFPNGTTPSDLEAGSPDPASWQKPVAQFQGNCDIPSHFQDMQIVRLSPLLSLFSFSLQSNTLSLSSTSTSSSLLLPLSPCIHHDR